MESLSPYLERLGSVPGLQVARTTAHQVSGHRDGSDATIEIVTKSGQTHQFLVQGKAGVLNAAMIDRVLSRIGQSGSNAWIVFAPYVTPLLAERLAEHHVNFIDLAGNCHLEIGSRFFVHVVGHRRRIAEARTKLGVNGYKTLLAILAQKDLADLPIRHLARTAGVSKSTAATALRVLEANGLLHETRRGRVLQDNHLLDRWVAGYAELLRPSLMLARYSSAERNLVQLEQRGTEALRRLGIRWAFSGGAAAQALTGHYRGDTTVVHLERPAPELTRELNLVPHAEGFLTILMSPGPVIFEAAPAPGIAPAALVYAELLYIGGERAREAAERVRQRYLQDFA